MNDRDIRKPHNHDFAPTHPNSTKCKWCAFSPKAHRDYKKKEDK